MININDNKPTVVVVDYGMGNLHSAQKGLEKAGVHAVVSGDPGVVAAADGVVLPGVGAFRDCMANLSQARLVDSIYDTIADGRPFLGICLGMQLLMTVSEEFGIHGGMDIIRGRVVRFPHERALKVPHMGWNRVQLTREIPLFDGIPDGSFFYFVHSYYVVPEQGEVVAGLTDYGVKFCSVIVQNNVFATQFHPEKSQPWGLKILENFGRVVAGWKED
ncbi:MAG: imidazole glycerol phosphate synthase subunit HisH [Deltaproteobacteria bacterium]|nr:imidazole glycerol phosphate synthase subunit HisH [Deltaproteobacteria bacterium]